MAGINKILFVTLSNIGDVILTLPVIDCLRGNFPRSEITVVVGPRPKEIFENAPNVSKLIVYDKHSKLCDKIKLFQELSKEKFDLVVDLRNSFFGAFLPARYRTSPFLNIPAGLKNMKERHLFRLKKLPLKIKETVYKHRSIDIPDKDKAYIDQVLKEHNIREGDKIIIISSGARSHIKRWEREKFAELIPLLINEFQAKIIFVGDKDDIHTNEYIFEHGKVHPSGVNLTAKTTLAQLSYLLRKAALVITNDSAVLHLASYLDRPVLAIFGPTNELKYGPWSRNKTVVKKDIFCRPCEKAQCRYGDLKCMRLIKVEDVVTAVKKLLITESRPAPNYKKYSGIPFWRETPTPDPRYKRILIVRTDRIGDLLLSTPVIKALRDSYPNAYIAVMVSPYAKDIVEGNPYCDGIISYDKEGKHKSWQRTLKFSRNLKKKKFDLAVILHPTNRVHWVAFLAGIPKRVGYGRKCGFLLTDKIKHSKHLGEKHELEYNLDLIRYLGIHPKDKSLFMPLNPDSQKQIEELFEELGINNNDRLLAIHPGASCSSKIWQNSRFAEVADKLIEKYGFKVLVVSGLKDIPLARNVIKLMRYPAIDLAGKTSVSQLASVLKRCQLFISNDSGPVHIASALGVPVISIFGRSQKGLGPKRWGPLGEKNKVLHKEVGCIECLAHNCLKNFECLKAITVDDVLKTADLMLCDLTPRL